jgi:glycerol-3-phosphate dehydrogenase (NAD(P)+)
MASVGVIGSGTWGTALAILLNGNGHKVQLWSAIPAEVESLSVNRKHPNLGDTPIPEEIEITGDLETAMKDKDLLVMSVPSVYVRQTAVKMKPWLKPGQIVTNVAKGIEEATLKTLSEVIEEELPQAEVTVLSGPSHAEEVSRGLPTTCVTGAHSKAAAEYVQSLFMSPVFRVYTSPDMLGIELGGALKNVIALAAGTADGLGCGDNTKAALITRGIAEITRLGTVMGGKPETFSGLTGIGDLIVTCASMHSRNRRAGILIGKGYTMDEAMKEVKMVVEGVYSAKAALKLAEKYHVTMPIVEQVNEVLFDGKSAKDALAELMLRDKRMENTSLIWDKE